MLSGMLTKIMTSLFSAVIAKIDAWFTQQQLAEAQSKAEGLKAYVKSIEESDHVNNAMEVAADAVARNYDETLSCANKLKALRDMDESRRLSKLRKEIG